jgi:hypothetical protein
VSTVLPVLVAVVPARTAYVPAVPRPGAVDAKAAIEFAPMTRAAIAIEMVYRRVDFTAAS